MSESPQIVDEVKPAFKAAIDTAASASASASVQSDAAISITQSAHGAASAAGGTPLEVAWRALAPATITRSLVTPAMLLSAVPPQTKG
jgi:hypothetical protein